MYDVIFVDDEAIIREGIAKKINWKSLGLALAGVCDNGREALDLLERQPVHVVLTDIYMPFMDGLSLSMEIAARFPQTKTVLLTGFDDFEYARKAVRAQVFEYVLKPVTSAELSAVLRRVVAALDEEAEKMRSQSRLDELLKENLPAIRNRFLSRLVTGRAEQDVKQRLNELDIPLPGAAYAAAVVSADAEAATAGRHESDLLPFAIYGVCDAAMRKNKLGAAFQHNDDETVLIFSGGDTLEDDARAHLEQIRQDIAARFQISVSAGFGLAVARLADLARSYVQAKNALQYRLLTGGNRVICLSDVKARPDGAFFDYFAHEAAIVSAAKASDTQQVSESLNAFIEGIQAAMLPPERCQAAMLQLLFALERSLIELDVEPPAGPSGGYMQEILKTRTPSDIKNWLGALLLEASSLFPADRESYAAGIVRQAEDYIAAHYGEAGLSVNDICRRLFISSSYLSAIFKNATKETLMEYLIRVRMEKATELLLTTNMKTYEIADRVGFSDPHYFSASYKKYTGETPTAVREKGQKP